MKKNYEIWFYRPNGTDKVELMNFTEAEAMERWQTACYNEAFGDKTRVKLELWEGTSDSGRLLRNATFRKM